MTTNSSLATYRKLTNKHSSRRGRKITKICIHHMAAVWTARQAVDYFYSTTRKASANYCVGNDGSIAQGVDEAYRAWTTSNFWVDSQAVTIEVSNSSRGGQWPVSNAALNSLINLVYDIAKRNNIYPVTYTGDKSGTLQKHEWYSNTNCPGPYLGSKFSYIANEVTRRLKADREGKSQSATVASKPAATKPTVSVSNKEQAYRVNVGGLNIRAGAGVGYKINGTIRDRGVYTISEVKGDWGRLKSGQGWINLRYCKLEKANQPQVKSVNTIAKEVIAGKWGNGGIRKRRLEQAGYNYNQIQKEVSRLLRK